MTALKSEHLENTLQVLTRIDTELKRYPSGFLKRHGSRNFVLANAYVPKTWKGRRVLPPPLVTSRPLPPREGVKAAAAPRGRSAGIVSP